jgi:hypothetical protein
VRAESGATALDLLELELRQLPGVCLVTFDERGDALIVQIGVEPDADLAGVRDRAARAADAHLDRPVTVEVVGAAEPQRPNETTRRVRLLATIALPDGEIEVHLTLGERRTIGRRRQEDARAAAVDATIDALGAMDIDVPYSLRWVGPLGDEAQGAIAVSLTGSDVAAGRYGVAVAEDPAEAAARATLAALNRFLGG